MSLVGYSPWVHKELGATERLSLHFSGLYKGPDIHEADSEHSYEQTRKILLSQKIAHQD